MCRSFDLPPTSIAKPLPAFHKLNRDGEPKRKAGKNRASQSGTRTEKLRDDTPRAFARLLNFQKTGKQPTHTLDDGSVPKAKKRKCRPDTPTNTAPQTKDVSTAPETATINPPDIKILPGERLADFSARVDQALPIAGLRTKGQTSSIKIPGVKTEERKTKHNRRLERMQKEWREEELRRKEKLDEEMEDKEDEKEEQQLLWDGIRAGGRKKKRKGDKGAGMVDEDDDPWAELEEKRRESKQKNLQDVVKAPPQLKGVKSQFKDHGIAGVNVGNVPGSVGSLRKREEIGAVRRQVIDEYRKMMETSVPHLST